MADAMSPESSEQGNTSESAAQGANVSASNAASEKMVELLKRQMESQSAVIRRLSDRLEKMDAKPQEGKEKKLGPISAMNADITGIKAELAAAKAKTAQARQHSAQQAIRSQLSDAGLEATVANLASEMIINRIRGVLQFEDDGMGNDVPVIAQGEERQSLSDFVSGWAQGEEGKALSPGKPAPSLYGTPRTGNAPSFAGKIRVTKADLLSGRVKTADVLAGKVTVIDA